ncbi:MAG TPA: tRNA epoxyqueuosine(34) reductase QueG [Bacteroidales bacterium]|nr:tRNA epoxyqueuosine(34) reductase QueG [Bacteroidales bacterium]
MNPVPSSGSFERKIKERLLALGFSACGIARTGPLTQEKVQLLEWLRQGMHAGMDWMERNTDVRTNPDLLLPGAKSLILVLLNYYPRRIQGNDRSPVISKYAYGKDYHKIIKKMLKQFVAELNQWNPAARTKIFVDSAPVMERAWAVRAGLGWQGKNSLLIHKQLGSFVFIGGIVTNLELEPDRPFEWNLCGTCTRCMDACPTKAIVQPGVIDARRCISYLTIEHKGDIPVEFRPFLKGRVFGCDICQDVCPWNRRAIPNSLPAFQPAPDLFELTLPSLLNLSDQSYRTIFSGTPVDRIGLERLKKNAGYIDAS